MPGLYENERFQGNSKNRFALGWGQCDKLDHNQVHRIPDLPAIANLDSTRRTDTSDSLGYVTVPYQMDLCFIDGLPSNLYGSQSGQGFLVNFTCQAKVHASQINGSGLHYLLSYTLSLIHI